MEDSDTVRVSKRLLNGWGIPVRTEVRKTGLPENRVGHMFALAYRLTRQELEGVHEALRQWTRECRLAEKRSMTPTEPPRLRSNPPSPAMPRVLAQRHYVTASPGEDLGEAFQTYQNEVLRILGTQRGERFLSGAGGARGFRTSPAILVFRWVEYGGWQTVERAEVHEFGWVLDSRQYGEQEDEFAPDGLRDELRRWRVAVRENNRFNSPPAYAVPAAVDGPTSGEGALTGPEWDDSVPYVDLPKSALGEFRIPGMEDGVLSDATAVLFGLDRDQVGAIQSLFRDLEVRFRIVEAGYMERMTPAGSDLFLLRRFPKAAAALKQEWSVGLAKIAGAHRAKHLDACIRKWTPDTMPRRGRPTPATIFRGQGAWPIWLSRGERDVQIALFRKPNPSGQVAIAIKTLQEGEPASAEMAGSLPGYLPDLRHLFRPDDLRPEISEPTPKSVP